MPRVLIFNFFGDVMHRGIPLYAADIAEAMRRVGIEPIELRCPRWFRRAPRSIRNVLFAFYEQIVAPIARLVRGCSLTVYPYNSAGIVDALLGRSVLVIHDLISNNLENRSAAAVYIRVTQQIHRQLGRRICAASPLTLDQLRRIAAFKRCTLHLWSNAFYSFEAALNRSGHLETTESHEARDPRRPRVMLCSGLGPNKDYGGALKLFAASAVLADAELHVVGFGRDASVARRRLQRFPDAVARRVIVHDSLEVEDLVEEYRAADMVWVHSRNEGFGRSLMEGRLSGKPVVATDIRAFRKHVAPGVYLYADADFDEVVLRALTADAPPALSTVAYHAELEASVSEVVRGEAAAMALASE